MDQLGSQRESPDVGMCFGILGLSRTSAFQSCHRHAYPNNRVVEATGPLWRPSLRLAAAKYSEKSKPILPPNDTLILDYIVSRLAQLAAAIRVRLNTGPRIPAPKIHVQVAA